MIPSPKKSMLVFLLILFLSPLMLWPQFAPAKTISINSLQKYSVPLEGKALVPLQIIVPADHHIYLEHLESPAYSILTDIKVSGPEGINLQSVTHPAGEEYENELILRDRGVFNLLINIVSKRKPGSIEDLEIEVKYQMCDDKTGVCYAPSVVKKSVSLGFSSGFKTRGSDDPQWLTSHSQAMNKAMASGKNLVVVLSVPSGCPSCARFENETLKDKALLEYLSFYFVPLRIHEYQNNKYNPEFKIYDVKALPAYLVVNPQAKVLFQKTGELSAWDWIKLLTPYRE